MESKKELTVELTEARELLGIVVGRKRILKIMIRWLWLVVFYFFLWDYTWARYIFWAGLVIEIIFTGIIFFSYFRLKGRIKRLEVALKT